MSQIFEDFKRILDYIRLIYLPNSNRHKKEVRDFHYNLDRYISRNKEKIIQNKDNNIIIEYFVKKLIQFLFYFNLIILKSESSSSIRHYFPTSINQDNSFDLSGEDFYNLINKYFSYESIGIKTLRPELSNNQISYFTISDYESIIKILLYWDNSGKFINKTTKNQQTNKKEILINEFWEYKFPNDKIIELRELFKKFEIYVHFHENFMEEIFGENGIIKKSNLTLNEFIDSFTLIKKPTRQAIYKWKKKKYIPLTFLIELLKSDYDFNRNIIDYISSIQIGKSPIKIKKDLVEKIKDRYNIWFSNFFPPPPSSKLGYLFDYSSLLREYRIDFLKEFKRFLKDFSKEDLIENSSIIENIRKFFNRSQTDIVLKSIHIKNFKSIEDLYIDFKNGINIFYGMNGSGKTSILEAIMFAFYFLDRMIYSKIRNLYNIEFTIEESSKIRVGKDFCKVQLNLISNNKQHIITRELWNTGHQKLIIDDQDIFDRIKNSINIDKLFDYSLKRNLKFSDFLDKIFNKSERINILKDQKENLKNDIFNFLLDPKTITGIYFDNPLEDTPSDILIQDYDEIYEIKKKEDKYYKSVINLGQEFVSDYFDSIIKEIRDSYKKINCSVMKNDIYSSLFLDYNNLSYSNITFGEIVSKKLSILQYWENHKFNGTNSFAFVEACTDFLFRFISKEINSKLEILLDDILKNEVFSIFLDKYCDIKIKYDKGETTYPVEVLSGGEESKLLLILLSILMDISSKSNFFLIDEPNELLDPNNIEIMKYYFFKLYRNKQVIICTFIDKYKEFQPALIYEVWKDHNNISHVFHIEDKEKFELYKKVDEIEKQIEENPEDYYNNQRKLILLIRLNRYEEALDFFNNIKGLDIYDDAEHVGDFLTRLINFEKETVKSTENEAKFYWVRALLFYNLKELHQAIENVDEAIKFGITIPDVYEFKADCLNLTNKPNRALDTIEAGIKLFPEHTGFHATKSKILEILGKYEEALNEIEEAITVNKDKNWNYYHKALVLTKLKRYSEALENLDKAYESDPHDFVYIQDKVNILEKLNRVDEALHLIEEEKDNFPDFEQFEAQLYQTKSYQLANSNKKEEAIETIKKAIKIDPEEANFYDSYGEILMNFNQYEEALEQFEKAKKLHFTPIQTYINLGQCLYELGRYEDALENLEIGKRAATHNVKRMVLTEDDRRISVNSPQTELIEESEKYIKKIKEKSK